MPPERLEAVGGEVGERSATPSSASERSLSTEAVEGDCDALMDATALVGGVRASSSGNAVGDREGWV